MSFKTTTFITRLDKEVQVTIAKPSQFILGHQQDLLPNWDASVEQVILFLQRSSISFKKSNHQTILEKDRLRKNFLRWGTSLIFALEDLGYESDLFDPRNGYPLLAQPGKLSLDDNATVQAILHYPVSTYNNCSLIEHPAWGNHVYPSTVVTTASKTTVEALIEKLFRERIAKL